MTIHNFDQTRFFNVNAEIVSSVEWNSEARKIARLQDDNGETIAHVFAVNRYGEISHDIYAGGLLPKLHETRRYAAAKVKGGRLLTLCAGFDSDTFTNQIGWFVWGAAAYDADGNILTEDGIMTPDGTMLQWSGMKKVRIGGNEMFVEEHDRIAHTFSIVG